MNTLPEVASLRQILSYYPELGCFIWRVRRSQRVLAGHAAGCMDSNGYLRIKIDGRLFQAHRIAWAIMHGAWPKFEIDHANGDKLDNRFSNLREATGSENCCNKSKRRDNESGFKGVHFHSDKKHWRASISKGGKRISLGLFPSPSDAHAAYVLASSRLHGEFANCGGNPGSIPSETSQASETQRD